MRTTMDRAGRVVVPKALRERLGAVGVVEVEIAENDGVIEIRPLDRDVRLEAAEDGRPVLRAPTDAPPLTDDDVRALIEASRR